MSYKILNRCPVCSSNIKAVRLKCSRCGTTIENEFDLPKLLYLEKDQLNFIEVFLKCRGNIKDVEKELKISYPTVRAKLDEIISELGHKVDKKNSSSNEIIQMLENGEIDADQAINMMKK